MGGFVSAARNAPPEGTLVDFRFNLMHQSNCDAGYKIPIIVFPGSNLNQLQLSSEQIQQDIEKAVVNADPEKYENMAATHKRMICLSYSILILLISMYCRIYYHFFFNGKIN